ncbi:hypothetical protein E2C01_044010 [Portunus trituberculatus]|uniref:Uncharacterized protein n=1 Tax=Portunus trituberculatus TaxID=210409 RepID=A0A5B7FXP0_PORTR|nr:hypothetical protein [Portunus trituberculatus]
MEEPCLLGLDFLVQNEACVNFRRMQMQVRGQWLPLILEDAAEQVENPVTSSGVEDERLELHCRVVREGETADATVIARGRQAAASSCGGEVDGDAGEPSSALSPQMVDLAVRSTTKLTPEQVVKLEKLLMELKDVFSRDAQDLGCMSLVWHSINTADITGHATWGARTARAEKKSVVRRYEWKVDRVRPANSRKTPIMPTLTLPQC